jgi:hypothetical protein
MITIKVNNEDIQIKKFEPDLDKLQSILIIGKRCSGKSWLIRDLIKYKKNVKVISDTELIDPFYTKFIAKENCFEEFSDKLINQIFDSQKIKKEHLILVLDDCLTEKMISSSIFVDLVVNGRCFNITLILAVQYSYLKPVCRSNFDYIFTFKDNSYSYIKRIYKSYGGIVPSFEIFKEIMDQLTENFGILVINEKIFNHKLNDCLMWYKVVE